MTKRKTKTMDDGNNIICRGIKTHNLKNIDVELPIGKWTAVTGVSGSGKSSLVFDTLFAESQRRFLETLGTYERQFLQGLPQGDFDSIENVPAAVALKQTNRSSDPRSVVGTTADIFEPMRILFSALMDASCSRCGTPVVTSSSQELAEHIRQLIFTEQGTALLSIPYIWPAEAKKREDLCRSLLLEGYLRVLNRDEVQNIEDLVSEKRMMDLDSHAAIVLDRITTSTDEDELKNRLETAWSQVKFSPKFSKIEVMEMEGRKGILTTKKSFMVQPWCPKCETHTTLIQSTDLDWQSALGACRVCHGIGNVPVVDPEKVIPNSSLSLEAGAIKPWTSETFEWIQDALFQACRANGVKTDVPFSKLDAYVRHWIWTGEDPDTKFKKFKQDFVSLGDFFKTLEAERYKRNSRILLHKYRKYVTCTDCAGTRLGQAGRNAICGGQHFHNLMRKEIGDVTTWVTALKEFSEYEKKLNAIQETYQEVQSKLSLLCRLGLTSSSLSRRCKSLSGGEYQRVLLTRVVGNGLTDALYVLDEPSVGLGQDEIPMLVECIEELRQLGNTIVMVEHDPSLVLAADHWIELGPGGGSEGGKLLTSDSGKPLSLSVNEKLLPEPPLVKKVTTSKKEFSAHESVFLKNFNFLNCKGLNLEVPLGRMTVVSGPSGAGKSTLIAGGLSAALERFLDSGQRSNAHTDVDEFLGTWDDFEMPEALKDNIQLVAVEQRAMYRSVSSVVATVLGLMDILRKNFAASEKSKDEGFTASDFSFNGAGGCESCEGRGVLREDLFFLGEVEKVCPDCEGKRYRKDVLEVEWQGKSIADWLGSNVRDCAQAFRKLPSLARPLNLATRLGLGHLPLGVATSMISGGEAQRLRICAALSKSVKPLFCLLDEPTRGLSERDIGELLSTFLELNSQGHTFVIVEHHELFQRFAHQLIRLGPGAGIQGGKIVERELRF
jgi:excinuclease ABC subunit A